MHKYKKSSPQLIHFSRNNCCKRCPEFLLSPKRHPSPVFMKSTRKVNPSLSSRLNKSLPKHKILRHTPETQAESTSNTPPQKQAHFQEMKHMASQINLRNKRLDSQISLETISRYRQQKQRKKQKQISHKMKFLVKNIQRGEKQASGKPKRKNIWLKEFSPPKLSQINERMMKSCQSLASHQFRKHFNRDESRRKRSQSFQIYFLPNIMKAQQITHYEFINLLGKGTTAQVYLARHKESKTLFAVKSIRKLILQEKKVADAVVNEIANSWKVRDPNVVTLYDVFDDKDKIYLVMEYLHSGSLYDLWKQNKHFSEKNVASLILDVCRGIKTLHSRHIIHRDIKLENIMLQCGVAKIGDLGCSIQTSNMQIAYCGSPSYLSPEQLAHHFYNCKIDMWSIGIMTYQLLFGFSPYEEDIYDIVVRKHKHHLLPKFEFPDEPEVSETAKSFVEGLLDQDIDRRMSAEQALLHKFLQISKN